MRDMHVAIISQRKEFSRFFELEAFNFGSRVTVFNESNADLSEFDLCIIDARMDIAITDPHTTTVVVGDDNVCENFEEVIRMPYPTSLGELQHLYMSILLGKDGNEIVLDADEEEKIYFYRF